MKYDFKKLPKRVKTAWLKALRSGKYEQAKRYMYNEYGFCCLGVLCDVAYDGYWTQRADGSWLIDVNHSYVPPELGLDDDASGMLMTMNDMKGKSFKQIANWIEKHL